MQKKSSIKPKGICWYYNIIYTWAESTVACASRAVFMRYTASDEWICVKRELGKTFEGTGRL